MTQSHSFPTIHHVLLLVLAALFALPAFTQVKESSIPFGKDGTAMALVIEVEGQVKNVQVVMEKQFSKYTGVKKKKYKGFNLYEGTTNRKLGSGEKRDYYFKVEDMSSPEESKSKITMLISEGGQNFIDGSSHPDEIKKVTEYLEGIQKPITIYELELAIESQTKILLKATQYQDKLIQDSIKLESKMSELVLAIEENKSNRTNQLLLIEKETQQMTAFQEEMEKVESGGTGSVGDAIKEDGGN